MLDIAQEYNSSSAFQALENLRMRLLDLTSRNRLINFRHAKRGSLRIIDELPNQLAETLLSDTEMRFLSIPEPTQEELIQTQYLRFDEESQQIIRLRKDPTASEWAKHLGFATSYEVPEESVDNDTGKHSDTAIQTLLYPYEMEAILKSLQQVSNSAIQEMGANILYLAFGFLEWFEHGNSQHPRIAPLFLLPVRLRKGRLNNKTMTYEYTLSYSGEDIIPNLSLREKLRADFSMALPDLDENTVPEEYFKKVQELIAGKQPRWRVKRYISLSLLNFSKLLMYLDLDPARWPKNANIVRHPVVSRFLSGHDKEDEETNSINIGFGEEYSIDEIAEVHSKYPLIDDADSSQHSALIDAIDGKNLVIEGPPGTGKSQTITNLIAAAMAQGKKVLFVAEKLAALEVVRSRLDNVGLGEFCLELHSHKSQKRKVLDEVDSRLKKNGQYRKPKDIEIDITRFEELKSALKTYAEKINRPWKNTGITLHEIFMAAARYRDITEISPELLHPTSYNGDNYNKTTQRRNEDQIDAYRIVYRAIVQQLNDNDTLKDHPWFGVHNTDLQIFDQNRVSESLNAWQEALQRLVTVRETMGQILECDISTIGNTVDDLQIFLGVLENIPVLQGDELLERLPILRDSILEKSKHYLDFFENIENLYASLSVIINPDILQDLSLIDQMLKNSKKLQQLANHNVTLNGLKEAIDQLALFEDQLKQVEEPLNGVLSSMDGDVAKHLTISESGLKEFETIVKLIAELSPSYWKYRNELFDNEEIDDILPHLRSNHEELQKLHDTVSRTFSFETIPDENEIHQLATTLTSGGMFRWIKGDWRKARKKILSWSIDTQTHHTDLIPMLDTLALFVKKRNKFENNVQYKEALGTFFQGMDTDVTMVESLRTWYKHVRQQYGIGFGQKVALGNAILELPPSTAQAIRSLVDRNFLMQLNGLLNSLHNAKDVFTTSTKLHDKDALLTEGEGSVPNLIKTANDALESCSSLTNNSSLSITEMADLLEKLDTLRQRIDLWEKANFDEKVFHKKLGLKIGSNVDNTVGLSMLRNTLKIANHVENNLNKVLASYIYKHPSQATFTTLASLAEQLRNTITIHQKAYADFAELVSLDPQQWMTDSKKEIDRLILRNQFAIENIEALQSWLDYVREKEQLRSQGLENFAIHVEHGELDIEKIMDAYHAGIFDLLAKEILKEDPEIRRFSGHSQEALQEKFQEYDNRLKLLQCEQIAWKIDQTKVPYGNMSARVSERTERILLEHECSKKTRHIPIRQLLKRAGNALVALKPCFMMGPMSVAQYLEPGEISFDLVIMDEASQIKPQDALGAIARGSQLVVVGDPKQLPPTSFFDRVIDDEEGDPTGIEDAESILDATLPMFPARRLRWHYRSQHESLIAFSNHSFYDGDLVLFPSPHKESSDYGIQYSRLPRGCFVNRRNMEEAKVISEAVREHLKLHPDETLGVVAMSAEQRLQIERAIETLAKNDKLFQEQLERDSNRRESFFVKNLENVQGDERDIIFISMTYGPQEPGGKVFQRFGPINSDAGWRRLNVLFTRARKRMHIFSSMDAEDIITSTASKRGVHALRDFLSFCESGILHKTERVSGREPDSHFEISVMNALRHEGFECVPQVGVAGFFIDIAVLDPNNPGRYLMGIECDGASYHSAKSVRDRDRLRQEILERLGWHIRRIWSTDWYKNPHGELRPIIKELNRLKSKESLSENTIQINSDEHIQKNEEVEKTKFDQFSFEDKNLREKLIYFDHEIIRKECPNTPENKRLLRPAMLEALLEFKPTSKVEFLEMIPSYIRLSTEAIEGKYLEPIFDIINASLE